ncbi:TPA: hypothetical protein L9K80_004881 [Klebsiella quasipneumoniae subsp. similipneumoniae]|nr:hypothetical protein [Klebsiella quasipneumoniae subsp. similipneumoniae]
MDNQAILRNSSILIAYMGTLGWGSAYFYGWGISFYYGFPWWVVSAGLDDVARSLFYAFTVMAVSLIGWGVGFAFFYSVKQRNNMHDLSVIRLFFAVTMLLTPLTIEFSLIRKEFEPIFFIAQMLCSLLIVSLMRLYRNIMPVKWKVNNNFVRKHLIEIIMLSFMVYFWMFSFFGGWYKAQFKKEYEMINYRSEWYYVIARYDSCLILSKSFMSGTKRFIIFRSEQSENYEINIIRSRI